MPITIIGIDPGLSGGIAWIKGGQILSAVPMPVVKAGKKTLLDEGEFRALLKDWTAESYIYIEQIFAMPRMGVQSAMTFGRDCGIARGIMVGLGFGYSMVAPQTWRKEILKGMPRGENTSGSEYLYVSRRWPSFDWKATERSRVPHAGMVAAACIAAFGFQQYAHDGEGRPIKGLAE